MTVVELKAIKSGVFEDNFREREFLSNFVVETIEAIVKVIAFIFHRS